MTYRVVIEERAEREFADAVRFYDESNPGLGQRFAHDVRDLFKVVCENPERFPRYSRVTRKAKVPALWPYSIYFAIQVESAELVIVTIWHGSRNPADLRRRLK
jgi:plasmid stabilization system protein ParE